MTGIPKIIEEYATAFNADDTAAMIRCFAPRAIVEDENREHAGREAIRAWIEEAGRMYSPRMEIRAFEQNGPDARLTAEISGTFPGSPALLRFSFTLGQEGIERLVITP